MEFIILMQDVEMTETFHLLKSYLPQNSPLQRYAESGIASLIPWNFSIRVHFLRRCLWCQQWQNLYWRECSQFGSAAWWKTAARGVTSFCWQKTIARRRFAFFLERERGKSKCCRGTECSSSTSRRAERLISFAFTV